MLTTRASINCTYITFLHQKPIFLIFSKHQSGVSGHRELIQHETQFKKCSCNGDFITIPMLLLTVGDISPDSGQNMNWVSRRSNSLPSLDMETTLENLKTSKTKLENGQGCT